MRSLVTESETDGAIATMTSRRLTDTTPFWYYETSRLERTLDRLIDIHRKWPWPSPSQVDMQRVIDQQVREGKRACKMQECVLSSDDGWQITVALPGLSSDDVDVKVVGDHINITTKKPPHACSENVKYTYTIDARVDRSKITATVHNGVLKVTVPRSDAAHDEITIAVK